MFASFVALVPLGVSVTKYQTLKNAAMIWSSFLLTFISNVFLFLFVWILTGENYIAVFAILLGLSLALMLLVELIWLLIGSQSVPWFARAVWAGYEFQQRARLLNKIIKGIGGVTVLVIFPLYVGLGFFRHGMTHDQWVRYVVQATVVLLFVAPQLTILPQMAYVFTSKNVLGDTRTRLFVVQLSGAISLFVLAALFIWSVGGAEQSSVFGRNVIFSPSVLYTALIYVTVVIFVPYLVGHYRAKDWTTYLEGERSDIVEELSKGLASPNWARVDKTLVDADQAIDGKINEMENAEFMHLRDEIMKSDKPADVVFKVAARDGVDLDPRFVHIKVLRDIRDQVTECRALIGAESKQKRRREIVDDYVDILGRLNQHKEKTAVRPWVVAALTAAFLALVNPLLTSVSKYVATKLGISG